MRIVFVGDHRNEHTRRWVRFFAEREHDVHVITCGDLSDPPATTYAVHDLGTPRVGKFGYLLKLRRARRTIRSLAPDLVHAHHATSYGLLGASAGRHPFVVTCHGSDVLRSPRNPLMRAIVRRVLRSADLITVPAEHVRKAASRLAGPGKTIAVFQYGVETERLARLGAAERRANASSTGSESVRLVTARPLTTLYRTADVVSAVALLNGRGQPCTYDVLGRGPEQERLETLARELGIADRVAFHGHVPEEDVERILARADCYVSVAESDGVSIALLEAMAVGAVPVVSDIEANRSWVSEGVTGSVVSPDPSSIADGITRALHLDRDAVIEANGRLVRERADRETNLAACEELLFTLVGHQ